MNLDAIKKEGMIKNQQTFFDFAAEVGLTNWLKFPPPPELVAWASQDLGANMKPLTSSEWVGLLETAGLKETVLKTYKVNVRDESKGILQRYGRGGVVGVLWRMLNLYVRSSAYRKFVKEIQKDGITPKNLDKYFGYGLYIGRK